jgi:hypothetical protein
MTDFVSEEEMRANVAVDGGTEVPDDNKTSEERIDWLRSKGIQIDIPGERKAKKVMNPTDLRIVKCVRIPWDDTQPLEEVEIQVDKTGFGDQLLQALKPNFVVKDTSAFNMDILKDTAAKQFGNQDIKISDDILASMCENSSVEVFNLDHPCAANKYEGVAVYLDEASQLKALPSNKRATQIARECGFQDVPLAGDMYLGRTAMKGTSDAKLTNVDFTLGDINSSGWMKGAEGRNYEAKAASGQIDMSGDSLKRTSGDSGANWDLMGLKWTETLTTMDVVFSMRAWADMNWEGGQANALFPTKLTTAYFKQTCKVVFGHASVKILTKDSPAHIYLDVALFRGVELDDCTYTLSAGPSGECEVELSMEKASKGLWERLSK